MSKREMTVKIDRARARYLVQAYLNDCGGIPSGFDYGAEEDALQIAIERAFAKVRAEERKAKRATPRTGRAT